MNIRPLWPCLALVLVLSGCGADNVYAPDAAVAQARFVSDQPPSVTLFTVVSNDNDSGAHAGLLINASQRVMYDPAGSWTHPRLPQRGDVFFGMTDKMVAFYIDYHARETYRMLEQTVPVSPAVAELVLQRALAQAAAPKSFCASATSSVLEGVPGFEAVPGTFSPLRVSKAFATIPGVRTRTITDDDADKNYGVLLVQADDPRLTP